MKPFLKWAGGKRWLAGRLSAQVKMTQGHYIEPFLGSGAVFFDAMPARAILSDANEHLIEAYICVRDEPENLFEILEWHHSKHCQQHYYEVRETDYKTRKERAAKFIYLNRTCWNGLYRVNQLGKFNVPIGTKTTVIFEDDNFVEVAAALSAAEIFCSDFEQSLERASEGDLVYVDPPYTVKHNFNGFLKYNQKIFSWQDQVRLRDSCVAACERGAKVIVSNADHESIWMLYDGLGQIESVGRASILAGAPNARQRVTEVMVTMDRT